MVNTQTRISSTAIESIESNKQTSSSEYQSSQQTSLSEHQSSQQISCSEYQSKKWDAFLKDDKNNYSIGRLFGLFVLVAAISWGGYTIYTGSNQIKDTTNAGRIVEECN